MGLETGFFSGLIVLAAALVVGLLQFAWRDWRNTPLPRGDATRDPDSYDQARPRF